MNGVLVAAGAILAALAGLHSVLGERLIFRAMGRFRAVGDKALDLMPQRRWDALWSTWHLISIWAVGMAVALLALASPVSGRPLWAPGPIFAVTLLVSAVFWAWGTRGRHPAWIGFLLAAALVGFGSSPA